MSMCRHTARLLPVGVVAAALASTLSAQIAIFPTSVGFTDISVSGTSIGAISDDSETTIAGATLTGLGFMGNDLVPNGRSIRIGNNGCFLVGNSGADVFTSATEVGYINASPNPIANPFLSMTASNGSDKGNG